MNIDRIQQTSFTTVDFGNFKDLPLQDTYSISRNCSGEVFILNIPYVPFGTITFDDKVTLPLTIKKPYFINFRKVTLNFLAPIKYSSSPFFSYSHSDSIKAVTFQKKEFYFDPSYNQDHFRFAVTASLSNLNQLQINRFIGNSFSIQPFIFSAFGNCWYSYILASIPEMLLTSIVANESHNCIAWNHAESDATNHVAYQDHKQNFVNNNEYYKLLRNSYEQSHSSDFITLHFDFYDQKVDESKNIHVLTSKYTGLTPNSIYNFYFRTPYQYEGKSVGVSYRTDQAWQALNHYNILSSDMPITIVSLGASTYHNSKTNPLVLNYMQKINLWTNATNSSYFKTSLVIS